MASCNTKTITVGTKSTVVTYLKENVAIGIVVLDLILGFGFWFSILLTKPLE